MAASPPCIGRLRARRRPRALLQARPDPRPPTSRSPVSPTFTDLHRLTIFADNLVPARACACDGVLRYEQSLLEPHRRRRRAAAPAPRATGASRSAPARVHAVRADRRPRRSRPRTSSTTGCWNRGRESAYKSRPRSPLPHGVLLIDRRATGRESISRSRAGRSLSRPPEPGLAQPPVGPGTRSAAGRAGVAQPPAGRGARSAARRAGSVARCAARARRPAGRSGRLSAPRPRARARRSGSDSEP